MITNPKKEDNTLYIICECAVNPDDVKTEILSESTITDANGNKQKTVTTDSTLQSFEVQNWNSRIYGGELVMSSIDNDGMIQNDIKHGQWIGEYGHPLNMDAKRAMIIFPQTASHRILNYRREGNLLKGHVQTLADGMGQMMYNRTMQGVPQAFSLRSLGSVDLATRRVKAPLKVITYDSVFRPSHIEAYQNDILSECATFVPSNDSIENIITESVIFNPISETMDDIMGYVKHHSDSVYKAAEIFKLNNLDIPCTLNENATRINMQIDENTVASVPIESMINMQYSDVLNSIMNRQGGC